MRLHEFRTCIIIVYLIWWLGIEFIATAPSENTDELNQGELDYVGVQY